MLGKDREALKSTGFFEGTYLYAQAVGRTHNQGKIREYRELLAGLPLEITWLDAQGSYR